MIPLSLAATRERPRSGALLAALCLSGWALASPACTFDSSGLAGKAECVGENDCPAGETCVNGRCVVGLDGATSTDLGGLAADTAQPDAGGGDVVADLPDVASDTGDAADAPDGGASCSGPVNACGGCDVLPAAPGGFCGGECGQGVWECASANALRCRADGPGGPNACGGCGALGDDPGTACGTCGEWRCNPADASLTCAGDTINACGGCAPLDQTPGSACGACGEYACAEDGESVSCDDPGHNACGGCDTLSATPGTDCNLGCGAGTWECSGSNNLRCAVASPTANACGGCSELAGHPGDPCEACGEYACAPDGESVSCTHPDANACGGCGALTADPGDPCGSCGHYACNEAGSAVQCNDPGANACGGCGTLTADPGDPCGVCADGHYACNGDGSAVACQDATAANACGGCGTLTADPGDPCGVCGDGHFACNEDGSAVDCRDATPPNACGGCGTLEGTPDTACGPCGDGRWMCSPDGSSVSCSHASDLNACGGCGVLSDPPGTACGDCGDGHYACNEDGSAVTCQDASALNACGGCDPLPGAPGDTCSCDGKGDAVYACSGTDLACADGTDEPAGAVSLGTVYETQSVTHTGWIDSATDRDWYVVGVIDVVGALLEPRATLTSTDSASPATGLVHDLCIFYNYTSTADITNYGCGSGDRCVWYDASTDSVIDGNCQAVSGFDTTYDGYGCCDSHYGTDVSTGWRAQITGVDHLGNGESGFAWVLVRTPTNTRPNGCDPYSLSVSF